MVKNIKEDTVVSLNYTVRLSNGELVDTSDNAAPLQYLHGHNAVIPGLEQALEGMQPGQEKAFTISPKDAYGPRTEEAVEWLERNLFPADLDLEPGMILTLEDDQGEEAAFFVSEIEADRVLADFNHPLAGEPLHFEVTVVDVRPATKEELAHGHVHQHGDIHH